MHAMDGFVAVLSTPGPPDRWADVGIDEAVTYLARFDDEDWDALGERLAGQTPAWRARCAQTLSEVRSERSVPLLLRLLRDDDPEVLEATVDSLASLQQDGTPLTLDDEQHATVTRLSASTGLVAQTAARLLPHP